MKTLHDLGRRVAAALEALAGLLSGTERPLVRDAVFAALLLLLGAGAGLFVARPWVTPAEPVAGIEIGGVVVPAGEARPEPLLRAAREVLRTEVLLTGPGVEHRTTWAQLGAEVEMDSLGRILVELARRDSPAAAHHRRAVRHGERAAIGLPISLVSDGALESVLALKETIDREPKNARFDFGSGAVTPEEAGRALDVHRTLARLDAALAAGENRVEAAVAEVPAHVTRDELLGMGVEAVVGFFETPYSRMRKDRDRTHNLELAASMLDGQVILPGEVFSFNGTLGDRSEARGFRFAPVIAGGALVEGMGGGTCQVASTLYAAAFFAGMVIVERQPHSRPSSYIKLGLDATVSYPDLDLKLRNPFDFPVVIHYAVSGGSFRAELRGRERPYTVTLLRRVVDVRPFPVRVIDSSKLARGREVVTQLGVPGYTVRRYKVIEGGKLGYRFQSHDKYPPTTQFVHKGVADPGSLDGVKDAPRPDTHKPYHASNYLRMVQGPDGLWYESSHE
jgi:vancomycin resistance protein YoaR